MISEKVNQLLRDIFLQMRNPDAHQRVKDDPEAHLLSLLQDIKQDLSGDAKYRVPLYNTVERASFQGHLDRAREELGQPV